MNRKCKGTAREHKTMRRLEAEGYRCTRAAASLGEWDIIAIGPNDVRLIQVKSNRWPGSEEMARLEKFRVPAGVIKGVWRWDDYAREPRIKLVPFCSPSLLPIYILLSNGKVAQTGEVLPDQLLVDYDSKGRIVGMEIIAQEPPMEVMENVRR